MADKKRNVLIANGDELIDQLSWPKGGGRKWNPYTISDARTVLHPQLMAMANNARDIPKPFAPRGEVTAQIILHPAYLAKSYFPASILRSSGLLIVGSKPVSIMPRNNKKVLEAPVETASIFVSGTADNFEDFDDRLLSPKLIATHRDQFIRIEQISSYDAAEKLRISPKTRWPDHFHVTLHATEADTDIQTSFKNLVESLGGKVLDRGFRFVPGLTFVAVKLPSQNIGELARFTRIRLVRSLPEIHEDLIVDQSITKSFTNISLPPGNPLSTVKAAIFDGGILNAFPGHVNEISIANQLPSSASDIAHGINVTSAFLYGHVTKNDQVLPRPYVYVDHHRVLPTSQSPEQALDVLDKIITALKSAKVSGTPYRFANISLGPVATFFDDDVHEWTSRLDTELADGSTLCTAAVGNNGRLGGELARIQPPGDAVNVFAIGAADSVKKTWNKADYSATGPGRSPGYVKPDVVAFGGSDNEPAAIFNPMAGVVALAGTSFASPLALRTAVGTDVLSGSAFDPVTLQALLINSAEFSSRSHSREEVGWGRIPLDPEDVLYTSPDTVRVVYQGIARAGHPQMAPIPLPKGLPPGCKVTVGATFCYRAPVDSAHAINYTRAGLWVRAYKAPKKSLNLFGSGMYKTESELRKDSMRCIRFEAINIAFVVVIRVIRF